MNNNCLWKILMLHSLFKVLVSAVLTIGKGDRLEVGMDNKREHKHRTSPQYSKNVHL